jgi:hypothetical protein
VAAGQFQRANIKVLILCRAHFVSLPAGAFGVAKECHPSAPSWREPHQNENAKHQKEKLIAGAGRGKKVGPLAPLKTTGRWHGYKNANLTARPVWVQRRSERGYKPEAQKIPPVNV